MGKKILKKMVVFAVAAALVISSGAGVFAASSSEVGAVKSVNSDIQYTKKTVTVTWTKVANASAYNVYKNGKFVAKVTGTSYTLKGFKDGQTFTLAIAPIAKDGKTVGKRTVVKGKTLTMRWMKNIKIKKAKKGKKKATITWKKVKGATGYQILYSKDGKTWKTKFVKGGKKTKATIKKLSKGKWYFKVRAVKGNYLGGYSKTKTAKVK